MIRIVFNDECNVFSILNQLIILCRYDGSIRVFPPNTIQDNFRSRHEIKDLLVFYWEDGCTAFFSS